MHRNVALADIALPPNWKKNDRRMMVPSDLFSFFWSRNEGDPDLTKLEIQRALKIYRQLVNHGSVTVSDSTVQTELDTSPTSPVSDIEDDLSSLLQLTVPPDWVV